MSGHTLLRAGLIVLVLLHGVTMAFGPAAWAAADSGAQNSAGSIVGAGHGLAAAHRSGAEVLAPFMPDGAFDPQVPAPAEFFGFPLGARPLRHDEVVAYLRALGDASPRIRLITQGVTHEGRPLTAALVSGEANMERLGEIKQALTRWADPRLGEAPAISDLPLCVWMGAGVHGDELSGTEAALYTAYHLVAGTGPEVARLRSQLLVLIDPLQNPDGRDRIVHHWQTLAGRIPDLDDQSMRHGEPWTGGRTNHYLFDLNRDWCLATQPETQGKLTLLTSWHPHLVIDAHEMSGQSTFLFSPPRGPFNPMVSEFHHHWWRVFAQAHAAAFDRRGWSYYTREWHEEWYPGFASSWAAGIGAVGLLYEQARVEGAQVARLDGTVLTFRETIAHQIESFRANLQTAVDHREELLRTFRNEREADLSGPERAFVILPHRQPARGAALLRSLQMQGIEVYQVHAPQRVARLRAFWTDQTDKAELPAGTLLVPGRQPHRRLLESILAFDPQMDELFLRSERRRLEREGRSRLYDVTGWPVSLSAGLPVYWTDDVPWKQLERVETAQVAPGCVNHPEAGFGFLIDGTDDRCLRALMMLWQANCQLQAALEAFVVEGQTFSRGSLLLKRALQTAHTADELDALLARVAAQSGVTMVGVGTALADAGPDLGSQRFRLLRAPRVGVVAGDAVGWSSNGAIAWLLDSESGIAFAPLQMSSIGEYDLTRYDVLILPGAWQGPGGYGRFLGGDGLRRVRSWVHDGGTLIATGSAAAFVADSASGLGTVRLRRQVLGRLAKEAARRPGGTETAAEGPSVEPGDIRPEDFRRETLRWAKAPGAMDGLLSGGITALQRPEPYWTWAVGKAREVLEEEDERMRLFQPRGAVLRVNLDLRSWLTTGCGLLETTAILDSDEPAAARQTAPELPLAAAAPGSWMPARVSDEYALVATDAAHVAGAFAPEDSLRLSGLLWPEARERWAQTAYLTRERISKGQVILFVSHPCPRGAFKGTERALLNAILLGPGLGTARAWPWE